MPQSLALSSQMFSSKMYRWARIGLLLATAYTAVAKKHDLHLHDTNLHTHGGNFTPDFYLRVTYENHTVACQQHTSVLVNGTSPGPTLRLPPGKTSWVRVCNDMDKYNTTMVQLSRSSYDASL